MASARLYWASGRPTQSSALGGGHGHFQRPRIGQADVLGGGDDQAPGDEARILAGRDHRRQPVQRRVRVVAADALDEGADGVVVAVSGPVVGQDALLGRGLDILQAR